MKLPVSISLDFSHHVCYVAFRDLAEGETTHAARIAPGVDVVADRDRAGAIVGIELLQLGDDAINAADRFAHAHGLAFPRPIGALVPS